MSPAYIGVGMINELMFEDAPFGFLEHVSRADIRATLPEPIQQGRLTSLPEIPEGYCLACHYWHNGIERIVAVDGWTDVELMQKAYPLSHLSWFLYEQSKCQF